MRPRSKKPRRATLREDERGLASSMIAFLVAGVLFIGSIGAVILTTRQGATGAAASTVPQADLAVQAESLSQVLVMSPGYTNEAMPLGPRDWLAEGFNEFTAKAPGADKVRRLGLQDVDHASDLMMSFDKFQNLRRAPYASNMTDGYVNYPDARDGFGLDDAGLDFHIRAYPTLPEVVEILKGAKDKHIKVLYIGDYVAQGGGGTTPPYVKGYIDAADRITVYVNVTNNGATSTIFDSLFEMELKTSKISFTLHTPVLEAGASGNMSFTVLKTSDWEWKNNPAKKVIFEVHDKDTKVIDGEISLSSVTMTYSSKRTNVFAEAEKLSTILVGAGPVDMKHYYQAYDGKGNLVDFSDWTFRVYDSSGALVQSDVLPAVKEGSIVRSYTATGNYVVKLWNDALTTVWNQDNLNIVSPEPGPYGGAASTYAPTAPVLPEVLIIDTLVEKFDANVFSPAYSNSSLPYAAGGDVYPDVKDAMNNDLPLVLRDANGDATLANYHTIIVGSNVDHNAMTSQAAKGTIHDWVMAGGTLITFGSDEQNVNWLQPLFHSAIQSSSGGLHTPDVGHPLLNTPDTLDHGNYDNQGNVWTFNGQVGQNAAALFTNVVVQGSDPILTESNPGSLDAGTVILTTWRPYDLYSGGQSADVEFQEGLKLVNNLLSQGYRDLFLDYGPPLPPFANVQPAVARVQILHPQLLEGGPILLNLAVYVFKSG